MNIGGVLLTSLIGHCGASTSELPGGTLMIEDALNGFVMGSCRLTISTQSLQTGRTCSASLSKR
jgi:hypothetical protein